MNECQFHSRISAYYDGELNGGVREQLEAHLPTCPMCSAELALLRVLSARLSGMHQNDIDCRELGGVHRAVDHAATEDLAGRSLLHTAAFLGGLAASLLIISGAWLMELYPTSRELRPSGTALALAPEWERVATTLRADPGPRVVDDSPFSPHYAAAVDWMLANLSPLEKRIWVKPS